MKTKLILALAGIMLMSILGCQASPPSTNNAPVLATPVLVAVPHSPITLYSTTPVTDAPFTDIRLQRAEFSDAGWTPVQTVFITSTNASVTFAPDANDSAYYSAFMENTNLPTMPSPLVDYTNLPVLLAESNNAVQLALAASNNAAILPPPGGLGKQ